MDKKIHPIDGDNPIEADEGPKVCTITIAGIPYEVDMDALQRGFLPYSDPNNKRPFIVLDSGPMDALPETEWRVEYEQRPLPEKGDNEEPELG